MPNPNAQPQGGNVESTQTVSKTELWSKVAALLLGIVTFMIPVSVSVIRNTANEYITSLDNLATKFEVYQLTTERRITLLEERQLNSSERLNKQEAAIDNLQVYPSLRRNNGDRNK